MDHPSQLILVKDRAKGVGWGKGAPLLAEPEGVRSFNQKQAQQTFLGL